MASKSSRPRPPGPFRYPSTARVMTSFENLVVLANYQEALRDARKMVWRDKGEPAAELFTIRECLRHAGRGGLRAGILGFSMRAGFNIFVLLFRIWKMPRQFRLSLVRHALLGSDSFRFAAMLGSFTAIYKFLLNALPILFPRDVWKQSRETSVDSPPTPYDELPVTMAPTQSERRRGRLSVRAQLRIEFLKLRAGPWYAAIAGAVAGGLAVCFERKGRRVTIAQQLFVRGLQGSYNSLSTQHNLKIPYGDVLLFSLCCGQIMYAFLFRADTIPKSYSAWIQRASQVPLESVLVNRTLFREGTFDTAHLEKLMTLPDTTPGNRALIASRILASQQEGVYGHRMGPCDIIHPWLDNCRDVPLDRFLHVARWMFPIYGALHLVPAVLFKRKTFWKNPWDVLVRAGLGTARSSAFLGVFVVIFQTAFCIRYQLYDYLMSPRSRLNLRKEWVDLLIAKQAFWISGLLSGLSLFVEEKRRRGELAMYVLPKGLESLWLTARGRGLAPRAGKYGEALLCAVGMGMVMSTYQNEPQHLSGLVRRILYQFIGPN